MTDLDQVFFIALVLWATFRLGRYSMRKDIAINGRFDFQDKRYYLKGYQYLKDIKNGR